MTEYLFINILNITITSSVLIAIVLLIFPLVNKKYLAAKWRYAIWLVLTIRLLIPFNLSWSWLPFSLSTTPIASTYSSSVEMHPDNMASIDMNGIQRTGSQPGPLDSYADTENSLTYPQEERPHFALSRNISIMKLSVILWIGGIFLFITYQFGRYTLFRRSLLRWYRPISQKSFLNLLESVCLEMGIHKNMEIMICKKICSPMVTGFIRPVVLLPHEDYDRGELYFILKHELTHYKRFDLWFKLLLTFAQAVHWFNPIVFLMVQAADHDMEKSCDEAVVHEQDMNYRLRYCEAILSAAADNFTGKTAFSTNFYGEKKSLRQRLDHILSHNRVRGKETFIPFVLVLFIVTSGTVFAYQNTGSGSNSQDGSVSVQQNTIPVPFTIRAENEEWITPTYSKKWNNPRYKERFPDSSLRLEMLQHHLFEMPVGASTSYPFYVNLGLDEENLNDEFRPSDYQHYVRLFLLNSKIKSIHSSGKQIEIFAEQTDTGYQVITINRAYLPRDRALIRLMTPDGHEVDSLTIQLQ